MASIGGMRSFSLGLALAATVAIPLGAAELNDYPTTARADYVFACMKTNGETRQALEQCSCSIDVIASILPYERYAKKDMLKQRAGADDDSKKSHPALVVIRLRRCRPFPLEHMTLGVGRFDAEGA